MIDCLLVHPGGTHGIDPVYGDLSRDLTSIEQPLWPRLTAGYLLDRDHSVRILDTEAQRLSPTQVAEYVVQLKPRLVAICVYGHQPSASTQQMVGARAVAEAVNALSDRPRTVMLGNHPSALPERTLREEPVDFVIDGEGPVTLHHLLIGSAIAAIPGLVWRRPIGPYALETTRDLREIVRNPLAPLLDLDKDLHGRAWHLLPPPSSYRSHAWQCLDGSPRTPYAAVYTTLGCSFKCTFCMINAFQHTNRYRRRDPDSVVKEMLSLYHHHDVHTFKIYDELFVLNRAHYRAVCEGLVNSGISKNLNIWAYARTDTVTYEDLPLMREAGIRWLALGIESGVAEIREGINKGHRIGDDNTGITAVVRSIQNADINVIGNYIFGLPNDDLRSMQATLDLALDLNTEFANFYCAMAYPGSALYDQALVSRPGDLPPSWAAYSQHNAQTYPLRTTSLAPRDVLAFRDQAFTTYFTSPNYQAMIRRRFGYQAVEHVNRMLEYKLERELLA